MVHVRESCYIGGEPDESQESGELEYVREAHLFRGVAQVTASVSR